MRPRGLLVICTVCFALLITLFTQPGHAVENSQTDSAPTATPTPGDRWMEIDLYWFEQSDIHGSVQLFWDRFYPLYAYIQGDRGLILNVGWTVGYIMEWSGDLDQQITLPLGKGQQPWVQETGPLPGSTADRQREWKERFASPIMIPRKGYGVWTYRQLRALTDALRQEGAKRGVKNFKVGSLTYGWDNAYGEIAPWVKLHPESFTAWKLEKKDDFYLGRTFDPGAKLHLDTTKLGGMRQGIAEGSSVHSVFAAQWGSLSKATGLEAIMLRDSFGMPVPYQRAGPWGVVAPSPKLIADATENFSALIRETKTANKDCLVMMYSNAASAISDWRSNGLDLERIAREGYLDVYVDQTWAGAWNEVGVRHDAFWNSPGLGWTYQLTATLLHGAMLSGTKVRHYPLIETFDAWESWDVLHTVPDRLRWGIWAYSHAFIKTPQGLEIPAGSYISWANQGKKLLTADDVGFLDTTISVAVTDAHKTTEVFGPVLVYARSAMQWQAEHAKPDSDVKEWLDEQAGSVIKWPVPVLSATRIEWLPKIQADMFVLGTPSHLTAKETEAVLAIAKKGTPLAIFGSPDGGIDEQILKLVAVQSKHEDSLSTRIPTQIAQGTASEAGAKLATNLPATFPVQQRSSQNTAGQGASALYSVGGSPALVVAGNGSHVLMWDPPTFVDAWNKPLKEIWGGSAAPYAITAGAMNASLGAVGALHAERIDLEQTFNVSAWRTSDGALHVLAGNLEEGLRDDKDMCRATTLQLPAAWKGAIWKSTWTAKAPDADGNTFTANDGSLHLELGPVSSLLLEGAVK